MKKIGERIRGQSAVAITKIVSVQCIEEERRQLRNALAIVAKAENALKVDRKHADWTMIHSYRFTENGFEVTVDQGACG